jgi:undecaprenyl pyrophosphate synthase
MCIYTKNSIGVSPIGIKLRFHARRNLCDLKIKQITTPTAPKATAGEGISQAETKEKQMTPEEEAVRNNMQQQWSSTIGLKLLHIQMASKSGERKELTDLIKYIAELSPETFEEKIPEKSELYRMAEKENLREDDVEKLLKLMPNEEY